MIKMNVEKLVTYLILLASILYVILIVSIPTNTPTNTPSNTPTSGILNIHGSINAPPVFSHVKESYHPLDEIKPIAKKEEIKELQDSEEIKELEDSEEIKELEDSEHIPEPKITTSFSNMNTIQDVTQKDSNMQQELIKETNEIPKIPKDSFEQVEIVCEKGICVRKHDNPFGYFKEERAIPYSTILKPNPIKLGKSRIVNKSNPFNL